MTKFAAALDELARAASPWQQGLWPARVESADDPRQIGRIKVRIFSLHGDDSQVATEGLPWAEVIDFGGGGPDYGSGGRLYPVGSTVWVMFEQGNSDYPVVVGGRRGSSPARDDLNPYEFHTVGGQDPSGQERPWSPPLENENPKDIFEDAEGDHPTRAVWSKSFKGHTILVEDKDEAEFLQIIDRSGQIIEMSCPVTSAANANNAAQRGTKSALKDDQLPQSDLVDQRGYVRIKDVAGQEILIDGKEGEESVQITSQDRLGTSLQKLYLLSKTGEEKVEITDKAGNRITLDANQELAFQAHAVKSIKIDTPQGDIDILTVLGDLTAHTDSGDAELSTTLGNLLTHTDAGDAELSTTLGNLLAKTTAGSAELSTDAGALLMQTLLGNADLKAPVGEIILTSPSVKLGSLSAVDALIKGTTYRTSEATLNTTLATQIAALGASIQAMSAALTTYLGVMAVSGKLLLIPPAGNAIAAAATAAAPLVTAAGTAGNVAGQASSVALTAFEAASATYLSLISKTV